MSSAEDTIALPDVDFAENALLLDVDGTLLDIASEPDAVKSAPSLTTSLDLPLTTPKFAL